MVRLIAIGAGLCALSSVALAQQATPILNPGEALVQVNATGEVRAVPDTAEMSASVTSDALDAKSALAANAVAARRLILALQAGSVAAKDLRTSDLSVRPRYRKAKDGDDTDGLVGYRASNRLMIRSSAADAGRIVELLGTAGASEINGPRFSFADDATYTRRARAMAVRTAQRRASDYADAFGLKTLRVVRVSERHQEAEGGSDIVVTGSRVSSTIQPGEQTIGVTVWIDYAMAR